MYGTKKKEVMVKTQTGSFLAYLRRRILKPCSSVTILYPILLGKAGKVMAVFAFSHQMSDVDSSEIADICRLGL